MKITNENLAAALVQLSMLRFFPQGQAQKAIALYLEQLCGRADRLHWLVSELVNHVGEWPGPAQVRGLFCSRYRPADGIEADCSLPGYTAADGEAISQRRELPRLTSSEATRLIQGLKGNPAC